MMYGMCKLFHLNFVLFCFLVVCILRYLYRHCLCVFCGCVLCCVYGRQILPHRIYIVELSHSSWLTFRYLPFVATIGERKQNVRRVYASSCSRWHFNESSTRTREKSLKRLHHYWFHLESVFHYLLHLLNPNFPSLSFRPIRLHSEIKNKKLVWLLVERTFFFRSNSWEYFEMQKLPKRNWRRASYHSTISFHFENGVAAPIIPTEEMHLNLGGPRTSVIF